MAESIEYSSIVKFINEEIIQGKLAAQAGGVVSSKLQSNSKGRKSSNSSPLNYPSSSSLESSVNDSDNEDGINANIQKDAFIKEYELFIKSTNVSNVLVQTSKGSVEKFFLDNIPGADKHPIAIGILASGLTVAAIYWMYPNTKDSKEDKKQNLLYILGTTIVAFVLSGPGTRIINYVQKKILNLTEEKAELDKSNQVVSEEDINKETLSKKEIDGGFLSTKSVIDWVKSNIPTILATIGATATIRAYFTVDRNKSLRENVARFFGMGSSSSGPVSYHFNASSGLIEVSGSTKRNETISSSKHFGIGGIKLIVSGSTITYTVNDTELNSISYIEGKPVHTALVMAYLIKDRKHSVPSASSKSDSNYLYSIENDGSVRLFEKKADGSQGDEVASINMAIRKQLSGDEAGANKAKDEVCRKIFKVGESDVICSAHFYNILGKSALGMLNNLSGPAKSDDVKQALINAQPHIQYEILKNLDWKMKVSNGNKEMVKTEQWLERLEQDARPEMKTLAGKYREYFKDNSGVKDILDKMVENLNYNTRLLDEKYKEAVATPQPAIRRKRARLSAAQVANLRSQVLSDNVSLNAPFPVPGRPGVFLTNYTSPFGMNGGAEHSLESKFSHMKQALASFNQKLSSDTERRINSKIEEVKELDQRLADIHRKINEYTRILRTEKYPSNIQRTVTLSDIENLINQYKSGTQEQTKQIVTLSTAFGKIKMLLEKADVSSKPSAKNYLFDL